MKSPSTRCSGSSATFCAGTSARYYRCNDNKKRGTCANKLSLREDVAKLRILSAIQQRFHSPEAMTRIRKRIAEQLGNRSRTANVELEERRARLQRIEEKIAGLIRFISNGDQSDYIRKTLLDLEAHAKMEKSAIDAIKRQATKAVVLPAPDLVIQRALDLQRIAENEPLRAREAIRRLFEGGRLLVKPQPAGHYIAEGSFFALALFTLDLSARTAPETPKAQPLSELGLQSNLDQWSSGGCAGRI